MSHLGVTKQVISNSRSNYSCNASNVRQCPFEFSYPEPSTFVFPKQISAHPQKAHFARCCSRAGADVAQKILAIEGYKSFNNEANRIRNYTGRAGGSSHCSLHSSINRSEVGDPDLSPFSRIMTLAKYTANPKRHIESCFQWSTSTSIEKDLDQNPAKTAWASARQFKEQRARTSHP